MLADEATLHAPRMTRLRHCLLACALVLSPAAATANMAEALEFCTDAKLTLEGRAQAFTKAGWSESRSLDAMVDALAAGIFLSQAEPNKPDDWPDGLDHAQTVAGNLRASRSLDNVHFLGSPDAAASITIEPNRSGLHTCLFAGRGTDLKPAADALGSNILVAGPRMSVRGDLSDGLLIAHALRVDDGDTLPLKYQRTFTVVLDRSSKGSEQ